jgi:hypothetical protein
MLMLVPTVVVATIVVGLLGIVLVHCLLKVVGEGMLVFSFDAIAALEKALPPLR